MMNERWLIALDLDGTLLTDAKEVTPLASKTLGLLRREGFEIVAATARPHRVVTPFVEGASISACVCLSGAVGFVGDEMAFGCTIPRETVDSVIARRQATRACASVLVETLSGAAYANFSGWGVEFPPLEALPPGERVAKLWLKTDADDDFEGVAQSLPAGLYAEPSQGECALIMPVEATKRAGVETMAERFGIPMSRVMAFGDDAGDIGMIKAAGVGVAMRNALPAVKAVADFVTEHSNEDDGVARFLWDYFQMR